ncbi:MAG: rhomboid family intramembrane serine protease [Pseudomonadales bacterium]
MTEFNQFAMQLPLDVDLAGFSRALKNLGIDHRITRENIYQVIWIGPAGNPAQVVHSFQRWQSGELDAASSVMPARQSLMARALINLQAFPLTVSLIVMNVLLMPVGLGAASGRFTGLLPQMTLTPMRQSGDYLYFAQLETTLATFEYWRLLTPMLLHFSWLHLAFNLLWVWELGRRVEKLHGGGVFVALTLLASLGANLLQLGLSGPGLFGGMSGVVFGYLGYCMVWDRLRPRARIGLAPAAYWVMLGFLILGFTGAFDLLGLGTLANGAHLGGLLMGALVGLSWALLSARQSSEAS